MKQYQAEFSLNRKQRGLLFYVICARGTRSKSKGRLRGVDSVSGLKLHPCSFTIPFIRAESEFKLVTKSFSRLL